MTNWTAEKETYCHTCGRWFHYLGITRHRSMHRDRKEDCMITFTNGDTYVYEYAERVVARRKREPVPPA